MGHAELSKDGFAVTSETNVEVKQKLIQRLKLLEGIKPEHKTRYNRHKYVKKNIVRSRPKKISNRKKLKRRIFKNERTKKRDIKKKKRKRRRRKKKLKTKKEEKKKEKRKEK